MSKVCVIVGVGSGNGAAFSKKFAESGYQVVMLARNESYLKNLSQTIPGSQWLGCDVSDPSAVQHAFNKINKDIGSVDVLVYNAGPGEWGSVEEVTVEGFEMSWKINTLGLLVSSQQVIPEMKKNQHGAIIVIGATAALRGGASTTGFASAKAAQRSLAQSMARYLGPDGIHVSYVVIDGIINLVRTREQMPDKPDDFFLQPDAIAHAVYELTMQDRSAWSFEIDLRPYKEKW